MLAVTENFQPGLMSQAMRLLFLSRGPWSAPTRPPPGGRDRPPQSSNRRLGFHSESTAGSQGPGNDDRMSEKMPLLRSPWEA